MNNPLHISHYPFCSVADWLLHGHLPMTHFILKPGTVHVSLLAPALHRHDCGLTHYGLICNSMAKQVINYQIAVSTVVFAALCPYRGYKAEILFWTAMLGRNAYINCTTIPSFQHPSVRSQDVDNAPLKHTAQAHVFPIHDLKYRQHFCC